MTRLVALATIILAPMILAACASTGAGAAANLADAIVGDWNLSAINKSPIALPAGARQPSLNFTSDGRVSGLAGVNRMSGSFDPAALASGNISFGPMAMTKMAGPPELMKIEDAFSQALSKVTSARIESNQLILSDSAAELLRFTRATK